MDTHMLRKSLGDMTQEEFAEQFKIPLDTVKYWDFWDDMPGCVFHLVHEINLLRKENKKLKKTIVKMRKMMVKE